MNNPVFDIDNWREIGATLAQNKTRTLLTAFGIFWGTAILALLLGGAGGFKSFMTRQFEGVATNQAFISPSRTTKSYHGFNKGRTFTLSRKDLDQIRTAVPQIEAITAVNASGADAMFGTHKSSTTLLGVGADYARILTPVIYEGRFLNEVDDAMGRKVCVVGKRVANELFGTMSPIGQEISVNGIYYKVVGVAGQTSEVNIMSKIDDSVLITNDNMRRCYNLGDDVGIISFTVSDRYSPSDFESRIRRILSNNHLFDPTDDGAVWFFDVSSQFAMVDNLFTGIDLLALFVGLGTLISGIIGVGNIMWIIVRERTQEIGIRRAIGAKPRDIIIQILCEGMILTLVAGLAGITFAAIVLGVVQVLLSPPGVTPLAFQMPFATAVAILAIFLLLGTLAGLIPSIKAMRIKPIEALNSK